MNLYLLFFLFILIPVLVHLFNFRRARKILFTNVRFIEHVFTKSKSKSRLKKFIILSSRILAFTFLVGGFFYFIKNNTIGKNEVVNNNTKFYYLDNSPSSYDINERKTLGILNKLVNSSNSSGFLLTNDFSPFSISQKNYKNLLEEINNIDLSYKTRSFESILSKIPNVREVFLLSDFQEISPADLNKISVDTFRKYNLVVENRTFKNNVFVDSIWVENNSDNSSLYNIKCVLGKSEEFNEGKITIKLLDSEANQITSIVKDVSEQLSVNFSLPVLHYNSDYKIVLDGDDLLYDNEYFFVIEKRKKTKILIITNQSNNYLTVVYAKNSLFGVSETSFEKFNYTDIHSNDLIIINDFYQLPNGLIAQHKSDKTLLVILSDSIDINNYEDETGIKITERERLQLEETKIDYENPIFNRVFNVTNKSQSFPKMQSRYTLTNQVENILSSFSEDVYFGKDYNSALYLLTTPLKDGYGEFPTHSIFLPLMYRIAEQSVNKDHRLSYYIGQSITLPKVMNQLDPIKIISQNLEFIPEVTLRKTETILSLPNDLSPNIYHLIQGQDTLKSFALNISKKESLFNKTIDYEFLKKKFESVKNVFVYPVEGVEISAGKLLAKEYFPNWKIFLLIGLMFFIIEILLHRILK